ncbi:unnamed protein product [Natator depressus]
MPNRTYTSKSERQAPGFKAAKVHVTVLFCGHAAGHLIKPGLLYRAANPCALKGKNKNLLPVFWQSNKKAWVMAALFLDWFHKCLFPEVRQYLEEKGLDFKVLLIVDNAPGHPATLRFAHNNVEVVFLPPSTTSILQPFNQGMIRCFKAHTQGLCSHRYVVLIPILMQWSVGSPSTLPIASLILNRQWMQSSLKQSMHVSETYGKNV